MVVSIAKIEFTPLSQYLLRAAGNQMKLISTALHLASPKNGSKFSRLTNLFDVPSELNLVTCSESDAIEVALGEEFCPVKMTTFEC